MATYKMTPADRQARAQALRERRGQQLSQFRLRELARANRRAYEANEAARAREEREIQNASVGERIGATAADVVLQLGGGIVKGVEGVVDALATVGGVVLGENARNSVQDFVEYDFTGEHIMDPLYEAGTKHSFLYDSKAGEIAQNVLHGVGGMLPAVGVAFIPGVGAPLAAKLALGTMAVSAGGNAAEEAYKDGAGYYKGALYGAASGGVEAATEKLTGGLTKSVFGKGLLDDVLKIGDDVAATGVRRVAKGMAEEATEEALAELANPLAKSIYKGRYAFADYTDPTYWSGVGESAVVGGLTSALYGGTVGRLTHTSGRDADIRDSLDTLGWKQDKQNTLSGLQRKQMNLWVNGTLDDNAQAQIRRATEGNLKNIETALQTANPKARQKLIERYGLQEMVDENGKLREGVAEDLIHEVRTVANADETAYTAQPTQPPIDRRYVSPTAWNKGAEIEEELATINADMRAQNGFEPISEAEGIDNVAQAQYNKKYNRPRKRNARSDFYTEVMIWERSSARSIGDEKIFYDGRTNTYNKVVVDDSDEGYGIYDSIEYIPQNEEAIQRLRSEVKDDNQRTELGTDESVYEDIDVLERIGRGARYDRSGTQIGGAVDGARGVDEAAARGEADGERAGEQSSGTQSSEVNYSRKPYRYSFPFLNKNFPSESVSNSEAHRLAVWWTNSEGVSVGDRTLISMHDVWYVVEKFDDIPNGYQVEERITKKEYQSVFEEIKKNGRSGQIKSVQRSIDVNDQRNQRSDSAKGNESGIDRNLFGHGRENSEVVRLDPREAGGRERPARDGAGDRESGGTDRQREGVNYARKPYRYSFPFLHKNFPSESVSNSEAHRLAVWWTSREDVAVGDKTLISMHDVWYVVEKIDDTPNGYQVEERITKQEYQSVFERVKKYGRSGRIKPVQGSTVFIDRLDQRRGALEGAKSSVDSDLPGYGGENQQVQSVDQESAGGRERPARDGAGDRESGGTDRQGEPVSYARKPSDAEYTDVKVFEGELSEVAAENYKQLKKAFVKLSSKTPTGMNLVLVNGNPYFDGAILRNSNTLYIAVDTLENGTWAKKLVHEVTHFAEGTREYEAALRYLLNREPMPRDLTRELKVQSNTADEKNAHVGNVMFSLKETEVGEKFVVIDRSSIDKKIKDNTNGTAGQTLIKAAGSVYDVSNNSIPDPEQNVKYSGISAPKKVIAIQGNSDLANRIANSTKSKYTVIRDYLVEKFYGHTFTLSDGKKAIMDKRDAQELAYKADEAKTVELANLRQLIENATLFAEDTEVVHNKFDALSYYEISVSIDNVVHDLVLNVGRSKYDGAHHIYDITKDKRTAHQSSTGVSRPVGYAIKSSSSVNIITDSEQIVKENKKRRAANQSPTGLVAGPRTGAIKNNSSANSIPDSEQIVKENAEKSLSARVFDGKTPNSALEPVVVTKEPSTRQTLHAGVNTRKGANGELFLDNSLPDSEQNVNRGSEKSFRTGDAEGKVLYSYVGKSKNGKSVYRSNYPINTPKSQKQKDLIALVQDAWSKKPITLTVMKDGVPKKIKASFAPELSERSDLAKIAFGNKKGTASEKRITMNLASDFYQIAEESSYNGRKVETGKDSIAHQNVSEWHCFVTNLVYEEEDGTRIDCHMNIDVKERDTGYWFYAFAIEKGSCPADVLSVVTDESATAPVHSIPDSEQNVKGDLEEFLRTYGFEDGSTEPVIVPIEENQELSERIRSSSRSKFNKKEEVPTPNGVTRPVGYAIQNTSSNNSISKNGENVKGNLEEFLRTYGFSEELLEAATKKYLAEEVLTKEERYVMSELGAHMSEEVLGNERFIERVVREDASLAEKIMGKLHDLMDAFKSLTSREARAEYKRLQQAEKLYLDAVEHAGLHYVEGQILKAIAMDDEDEGEEQREVEYAIKYPTFGEKEIADNMEALADMESVANIDASKLEKTGKAPSTMFEEFFASLGNSIHSDVFGDITLGKSSAKSEIRHGITATKIASMEAIPSVIKHGKVIFYGKKDGGVERIVVGAPIKIGKENYYMGVMLQRDAQTQYLYLHNFAIEKEMLNDSKTHLVTTGVNEKNEHLSMTIILQNAIDVKLNRQKKKYSYEALTSKDDISVVDLPFDIPRKEDGRINNKEVVARGKLNAKKQNNPNNTETSIYVRVDDIGQDVLFGAKGLDHGLARSEETARAVMKIGDILKSSVAVNELNGSTERKTEMSYVLLGACRDSKHFYVVRSVVSKLRNEVTEFDIYQISAVKAKKAETSNPALVGSAVTEQSSLISSKSPTISIAELFENVKNLSLANEMLSKDVLKHLGVARSEGTLSDDVRYSLPDGKKNVDPRSVTEEDVRTLLERVKKRQYKDSTYIPIRINTPQVLIDAAKEFGEPIENLPMLISVGKARQAMADPAQWIKEGNITRPHELSVDDMIEILRSMNHPKYIIYQTAVERYVEVVKFETKNKETAIAVIEVGEHKNPEYLNGYSGGEYQVLVTTFTPDDGIVGDMLENPQNKVLFPQKKKGSSQRGSSNKVPSHLNDSPFAISISDSDQKSNRNSKNNSEKVSYSLKTDRAATARKIKTNATENHKKVYTKEDGAKLAADFFVDNYTEEQYNHFGWVRANDILNLGQARDFYSKLAAALAGTAKFPKTKGGEYMIAVSDIYDSVMEGVECMVVYAKGTIESPEITRVLEIDEYQETKLAELREEVYALEAGGIQAKTGGVFYANLAIDFTNPQYGQSDHLQDGRYYDELGVRRGRGSEALEGAEAGSLEGKGREVSERVRWYELGDNGYTQEQYNDFGWVRVNDILNLGQARDFYSKFAEALAGTAKFPKTKGGEYMIAVSDVYDSVMEGVECMVVYAKGTIESPEITRVLEIDEYDASILDKRRRDVYALEGGGIQQKTGGVFYSNLAIDFQDFGNESDHYLSNGRNHDERSVRRGGGGKTLGEIAEGRFGEEGGISDTVSFSRKPNRTATEEKLMQSRAQVKSLRGEIRRSDERNILVNRALDCLQKLRDLKLGTYHNVAEFNDARFRGSVERLAAIKYRGNLREAKTRDIFKDLLEWYTIENALFQNSGDLYCEEIHDMLAVVASGEGALSNDDLRYLIKVTDHMTHLVKNYNKVYVDGRYIDAKTIAKVYLDNVVRAKKIPRGALARIMGSGYMRIFADPVSLMRYMDMYNENGFYTEMFHSIQRGAIEADATVMELLEEYEAFWRSHKKYGKHISRDTVRYQGADIPVNLAIGLYMTSKREQAHKALVESGVVMELEKERKRFAPIGEEGKEYTAEEMRELCESMGNALYDQFTEEDREFISIMEKCFNERCAALKNEIDMIRFGYTNLDGGYYYPIVRANVAKNIDEESFLESMEHVGNLSINKNLVKGAAGELLIRPVEDVFVHHVHQVSRYFALAIPTDNFNRLFNLNVGENRNKPISIKTETEATELGRRMNEYLRKLKGDVAGMPKGARGQKGFQKLMRYLRSVYAKYQLGFNPKTIATQFASFAAAGNVLRIDSIIKGIAVSGKDVDKYCVLAKLRNHENAAALAQGTLEELGRIGDITMKPIGWIDRLVIEKLFGACQVEIETLGGAKIGTEENKVAAGKLLEKVILETQQNALATERSGAMRADDELLKSVTMFSADAMKMFGRLLDAIGEVSVLRAELKRPDLSDSERKALQERLKKAKRKLGRAIGANVSTAVYMALLALLFRQLYGRLKDENEDGKLGDEVVKDLALDTVGSMIGGLPICRDIYSFFTDGFEMENFIYAMANDMLGAVTASSDLIARAARGEEVTNRQVASTVRKAIYAGGQVVGVPVRNVYNFSTGIVGTIFPEAGYHINAFFTAPNYTADLTAAIEAGDARRAATIASLMMNEDIGDMSSAAREAIRPLVEKGYKVLPRAVGDTVVHDGEEIKLTRAQKKRFNAVYSAADEAVEDLVKLSAFRNATDEEKARALKFIWDTYFALAMDDLLGEDSEKKAVLFAEAIPIEKLAIIVAGAQSITADVDKNGRAVSGSRKAKITSYISSLRMTAVEKYMLMGYLGYSNTHGEREVRAYISKLNLSKNEKAELFRYSGYAA